MDQWKKDETKFLVNVNDDGSGSSICRIPKPLLEYLNISDKILFEIGKNGSVC